MEGFFVKLTRRRLEHGVFRSVGELQDAIHRFIDEHNTAEAKPFIRIAQPGEIVAARKRRGPNVGLNPLGLSVATGSAAGLLVGALSMGGPPIFLYLMAGPGDAVVNRAQFVTFSNFAGVMALAGFSVTGAFAAVQAPALVALLLAPVSAGIWLGDRMFRRTGEDLFRRLTLWGMVAVSLCVLVI